MLQRRSRKHRSEIVQLALRDGMQGVAAWPVFPGTDPCRGAAKTTRIDQEVFGLCATRVGNCMCTHLDICEQS